MFFGAGAEKAEAQNTPLFTFNETPKALPAGEKYSVASIKEAGISIDLAELSRASAAKLDLPLFDGKTYRAQREEIEIRSLTDLTWRGKIREGKFVGDVMLTLKNGYVAGLIYSPGTVYEIVPRGDRQILVQLDQRLFPECAGDIKGDPPRKATASAAPEAAIDSGDRIDVLMLYTTPVKNSLGGDAQAQAFAQSAIDVSNTTYRNSKIRQRVRLVNAQETTIAETGCLSSELTALRANAGVGTLRNTFQADLVAMLSNSTDACGIGFLMGSVAGNPEQRFYRHFAYLRGRESEFSARVGPQHGRCAQPGKRLGRHLFLQLRPLGKRQLPHRHVLRQPVRRRMCAAAVFFKSEY